MKALACALPQQQGVPLSRFSCGEIAREVRERGIAARISTATVWRWLSEDAIRPWRYRSWIFSSDPAFQEAAGRVLDLYHDSWEGEALGPDEYVISADEKTSIQARRRLHVSLPPGPGKALRVEHEYERQGALTYLAAWEVRGGKIYGRLEENNGIEPFGRLVEQVMSREPYRSAKRVFWIMDNCSSHRGQRCALRLKQAWPNLEVVHLPVHASWLNQIEIYFSILQRKVLTPNDFVSLPVLSERILAFEARYGQIAHPFEWKFTRQDLSRLIAKLSAQPSPLTKAA